MMTAPAPPPPDQPLILPARRVGPSPERDRRLRRLTTGVGSVVVLAVVLALAALTAATWFAGRGHSATPAVTGLGSPAALSLTSTTGDVRVLTSPEVDELTLALVAPGAEVPARTDVRVQATLTRSSDAERTTVEVHQPSRSFGPPWADSTRDVLLLVPAGLELALEVRTDVGDVDVDAPLSALVAHADVGDLRLGPLTAPGGVRAHTGHGDLELALEGPGPVDVELEADTGDVELTLPDGAEGRVSIVTGLGDVHVAVPGSAQWTVRADSDLGEVRTAPGLEAGAGEAAGTLRVASELGTVSITR